MLCNRCMTASRVEGSHFCETCKGLCTKCKSKPRREGHRYCQDCNNAYAKNWRKTNPLSEEARKKANARAYATTYLRRGRLVRGPCEVPGCTNGKTEMHHDDYSKPLDVRWLCRKHHEDWHKGNGIVAPRVAPPPPEPTCKRCKANPRREGKLLCEICAEKCAKCGVNPKQSHHRWCAPCRADNERERRSVRITLTRQELKTLLKTARKAQISL